ncbi:MAG: hypothetical protein PWQ77_209 [Kosmotogales bacterium]|nr:hypothetical protein [Kosmotogales bacterium]
MIITAIYIIITVFLAGILLYTTFKHAKKWEWVMSAMIIVPMILRILLIK